MPTCEALVSQAALMDAALQLVDERADLPAGTVLRCFSRAVVVARRAEVSGEALPGHAEALARRLLSARNRPYPGPRSLIDGLLARQVPGMASA